MTEIGERAREIIKSSIHRSIKSYALNAGIKVPTLTAMVNRGVEPRFTLLEAILKASPKVSAEWLMRGEGPMYKGEGKEVHDSNESEGNNNRRYYTKTVVDSDATAKAIAALQEQLRSKDEQLRSKDEQLRSKDEQLRSKDEQLKQLFNIVSKKLDQNSPK